VSVVIWHAAGLPAAAAWSDLAGWAPLDAVRDRGPALAGAVAVGLAAAALTRRAGGGVAGVATTSAVVALSLAWIGEPGSVTALGAHLLIIAAMLLTVAVRTTPPAAALGLAIALVAGLLNPGAWLLAPAVPAAALAGNEARQRRFVLSALIAVMLLAAGVGALTWWTGNWSPPWPPIVERSVPGLLALPGLVATLVAAMAASVSAAARSRRQQMPGPARASSRRALSMIVLTLAVTGAAAAVGGAAASTAPVSSTVDHAAAVARGTTQPTQTGPPSGAPSADPCPAAGPPATAADADSALIQAAAELRRNQNITLCAAGAAALDAGQVDGRLIAVLALLADGHRFRVDHLAGTDARLVVLESPSGTAAPAADGAVWLRAQRGPYAPTTVMIVGREELWISYAAPRTGAVETPIA